MPARILLCRFCVAMLMSTWALASAAQVPQGEDFQVNTYTTNAQYGADVGIDAAGDFVIAWTSLGSDGSDTSARSIQIRRFASAGTALGSQVQVNSYTTGNQNLASIAVTPDGGFVVVWQSEGSSGSDTSSTSIQARRFGSDGSALGDELQVNAYTTNPQLSPAVAAGPDGNFVVVWTSYGSDGPDFATGSIQIRRYTSDGTAIGDQIEVNTYATGSQGEPAVGLDAAGGFVVAWRSSGSGGSDTSSESVQGQRFSSDAVALGDQFQVNSYTEGFQFYPALAVAPGGDFVIAWTSSGSSGSDNSGYSIQAQRYGSDGSALGGEFQVNAYTTSFQFGVDVAIDAVGDFVVTWESLGGSGSDSSYFSVEGQRFGSDGSALGDQFQVNSYTTETQASPAVALAPEGDFVVAWRSDGSAGTDTGSSIQTRRFRVTADLGDRAWDDLDADGLQGAGEPGVEGLTVNLYTGSGALIDSTVTDASGRFLFPKRRVGDYFLEFESSANYTFTAQDVGADDAIDSDVDPNLGQTVNIELAEGVDQLFWDAGLISQAFFRDGFESGDTSAWSQAAP